MTAFPLPRSLRIVAAATLLMLLVPAVAMQFSAEVRWGPGDFVVAGALLFGAGSLIALGLQRTAGRARRTALVSAVVLVTALIWAELAVGLFR